MTLQSVDLNKGELMVAYSDSVIWATFHFMTKVVPAITVQVVLHLPYAILLVGSCYSSMFFPYCIPNVNATFYLTSIYTLKSM